MTGPGPLYAAVLLYAVAALSAALARRREAARAVSPATLAASALGISAQILFAVTRTISVGFLPFASRFEALTLFGLAVQVTGFALYLSVRQNSVKAITDSVTVALLLGALVPAGFHPGGGLNPILNSPWFAVHILVSFAGYGCLTAGLAWSVAHLFDWLLDINPHVPRKLALAGIFLLGSGILTGAMWADSSWGTYWNWDPKEAWALLTWMLMMTYIHRWSKTPRRRVSALFFALSFATMMFTFIGINLLRWGSHRYG